MADDFFRPVWLTEPGSVQVAKYQSQFKINDEKGPFDVHMNEQFQTRKLSWNSINEPPGYYEVRFSDYFIHSSKNGKKKPDVNNPLGPIMLIDGNGQFIKLINYDDVLKINRGLLNTQIVGDSNKNSKSTDYVLPFTVDAESKGEWQRLVEFWCNLKEDEFKEFEEHMGQDCVILQTKITVPENQIYEEIRKHIRVTLESVGEKSIRYDDVIAKIQFHSASFQKTISVTLETESFRPHYILETWCINAEYSLPRISLNTDPERKFFVYYTTYKTVFCWEDLKDTHIPDFLVNEYSKVKILRNKSLNDVMATYDYLFPEHMIREAFLNCDFTGGELLAIDQLQSILDSVNAGFESVSQSQIDEFTTYLKTLKNKPVDYINWDLFWAYMKQKDRPLKRFCVGHLIHLWKYHKSQLYYKKGVVVKNWKSGFFILDRVNGILSLAESEETQDQSEIYLDLKECTQSEVYPASSVQGAFKLKSNNKTFEFHART